MSEDHKDRISRVAMMAAGDETWDLSGHDIEALKQVLEDRDALFAALELYEKLDDQNANCQDCYGEGAPEACGTCFTFADDARLAMRAALKRARGE